MNDDLKMIQLMLLTLRPKMTFQAPFYDCFNRTIHTERTRLERERSTHYNRSYSRISDLECTWPFQQLPAILLALDKLINDSDIYMTI